MSSPFKKIIAQTISLALLNTSVVTYAIANDKNNRQLDTIIITGDRSEKTIWDSAVSVSAVNSEDIEKQNGDSIVETLRDIPSIEISDNSLAGRKQIMIRGEAPSRILVLIDGQEVTYHRSGHGSSAGILIDMESVEKVEVIKGPHSVLYGSQAIGGVVNFITRKGSDEHKKFAGHLKSIYNGSTNGFTQQGSILGTVDNFDYRISGSYSDQGDRKTPQGRLKDTNFDNKSASAWFGYRLDQHKFGLSLDHYELSTSTYYDFDANAPEIKSFSVKIPKLERNKVGLFYDYDVGGSLVDKIHFDTYFQKLEREFRNHIYIAPMPTMTVDTQTRTDDTQDSIGMTLHANLIPHQDISLITGIQLQQDTVDQTSTSTNIVRTPRPAADYDQVKSQKNKWQQSSISLFAQNEWDITDNLTWNLGVRQYWIESKLKNGKTSTTQTPTTGAVATTTTRIDKARSDNHSNFVVSSGLTYSGFENTQLRLSFGQGYVYPTLAHLYGITSAHSQVIYGNSNLEAEKSNNYEMGLRYNNNQWVIDSSVYYSTARNYITEMVCNGAAICDGAVGTTNQYYANANKAKTYGAELSIDYMQWDIVPYIKANYIRRQIETNSYTTYKTGSPKFAGSIGLKNTYLIESLNTDLDSDLFIRAATNATNRSGDSTYYYSGWATLNLSMTAAFGPERQYQLGLDLNNILNKDYTTARETIPAAKFHALISASMKF